MELIIIALAPLSFITTSLTMATFTTHQTSPLPIPLIPCTHPIPNKPHESATTFSLSTFSIKPAYPYTHLISIFHASMRITFFLTPPYLPTFSPCIATFRIPIYLTNPLRFMPSILTLSPSMLMSHHTHSCIHHHAQVSLFETCC